MKIRVRSNAKLEWLLQKTSQQFLVSPRLLRCCDKQAWRVAARDAFCGVAYMHQLGSAAEIAATLGRNNETVREGIVRATQRLFLRGDLVSLAMEVLGKTVAQARVTRTGPFSADSEFAPKTPPEGGMSSGRHVPTRRAPSRASTPRPTSARANSSDLLTSDYSK